MYKLFIIIGFFTLFAGKMSFAQSSSHDNFIIEHLGIKGYSNMSNFEISFRKNHVFNNSLEQTNNKEIYSLNLPVDYFSASNRLILYDFKNLIDAKKHPIIKLIFSKEDFDNFQKETVGKNCKVSITIAGVTKEYSILYSIVNSNNNQKAIIGATQILLTDFQLNPSSRFFRIIKVEDKVDINFKIYFSQQNNFKKFES